MCGGFDTVFCPKQFGQRKIVGLSIISSSCGGRVGFVVAVTGRTFPLLLIESIVGVFLFLPLLHRSSMRRKLFGFLPLSLLLPPVALGSVLACVLFVALLVVVTSVAISEAVVIGIVASSLFVAHHRI